MRRLPDPHARPTTARLLGVERTTYRLAPS